MRQGVENRKRIVRSGLIVLLAMDVVLVGVNWRLGQSQHIPTEELSRLEIVEKSYRADTARLAKFREELPADEKQWDDFFTTHFRPAGSGYSAISADLGELSHSAGLQTDTIAFHQHVPDSRGLMQVDVSTAVEGNYDGLLSFLNKLEHSDNFYVLDGLTLTSSEAGKLRLSLSLRTYFRT